MMNMAFSGTADSYIEAREDTVGQLRRLGFTDYESRAYLALCDSYPATAYEVSKGAKLPKSNVYNVLKSLEMKEAIQPVSENPVRYVPRDPEEFFGRVADNTRDICKNLSSSIKQKTGTNDDFYIWSFRSEKSIRNKLLELIAGAKEQIWLKTSARMLETCLAEIADAAGRGVRVTIILSGKLPEGLMPNPGIQIIPHEGSGAPVSKSAEGLLTMVIDFTELFVGKLTGDVICSYSRNSALMYVFITWFTHEMFLAEIYAKHGPEMDASFGSQFSDLRRKYRPRLEKHFPFADWEMVDPTGQER
jgi:predicted transcriptional regulator